LRGPAIEALTEARTMKASLAAILLLFSVTARSATVSTDLSPVTRVVELLQGLSKKAEFENKQEEDLYETYVCWAKTIIDTKTASNQAATSRIDELEQYLDDLENGRIELTTERVDLEKELEGLNNDIESAEALRKQENDDFLEAQDEMQKAIAALEKATQVLREATEGHAVGTFLSIGAQLHETAEMRAAEAASLSHAVELGERFLSKGDALFLKRMLSGEVPVVDWKKLNRKAVFKMKYKARSFKIQDVLAKLLQTFKINLSDAEAKEAEAVTQFDKLMASKRAQKEAAEEALRKMIAETGARSMSKSEVQDEVDALKTQVENDMKYIKQVTTSLGEKKEEWKDRQALRAGEIAAISKAISILHSDDARDLFKQSLKSQGYDFLQTSQYAKAISVGAASTIRRASTGDRRLVALASRVAQGGHFDKVIAAIDKMVATLKKEIDTDLAQKEQCEKDRAEDTREAALTSRAMDEMSDAIFKLKQEIEAIVQEISEAEAEIKSIQEQLVEGERVRTDEHAEWQQSDKDDKAASELVARAKDVLENFYKENGLGGVAFVQQEPYKIGKVEAGKAPPPPPTTWEAPYGGKKDVSTGIVAILEMIKADIDADIAKALASEESAAADYKEFVANSEEQISTLTGSVTELTATKSDKETDAKNLTEDRATKLEGLHAILKKIKDALGGCDYIAVNFNVKTANHQIEIDGLIKAKAILTGAAFGTPADPSREIKPGDAFLQRA